jgi:pantoate--beta-alanine ligase
VREDDGLALSSRNAYLNGAQRQIAPTLHRTLVWAVEQLTSGFAVSEVESEAILRLYNSGFDAIDYFQARDPVSLERLGPGLLNRPARVLAAARLGRTRLIDNLARHLPGA